MRKGGRVGGVYVYSMAWICPCSLVGEGPLLTLLCVEAFFLATAVYFLLTFFAN